VSESPRSLSQLLRSAKPDRVADLAVDFLTGQPDVQQAEVLLADYRVFGLWPVVASEHASAGSLHDQTTAGRAFGSQRTVIETVDSGTATRVLIPLTIWSDRLGVLVVELADGPTNERRAELRTVADELAIALSVADRSTDRYRLIRRRRRLTLAAEMQWDLLPGRALGGENFLLAGQLEPAYAVSGDHFDWSLDGQRLTVTTLNGDGSGIDAAMLTALTVAAMRNARRSGGNLIEQAELASDAIYGVHGGEHSVGTLLMEFDLGAGRVTAIDAGSPQAFRMRGGHVTPVKLDQQLPLGMFQDTRYEVQTFNLEQGERLFVVSDGVHAASSSPNDIFGTRALLTALRGTRLQPATEAVGSVMRGLHDYLGDVDLADDAVIVCLDWQGTPDEVEAAHQA
jgi:serine phosphatase RsbU (regulator of sigma subunit)